MQVYGERADGWIAAWGMTFDDRTEVIAVDGGLRMNLKAPEHALRAFTWGDHVTARLVWVTAQGTVDVGGEALDPVPQRRVLPGGSSAQPRS
ncbi:MAG: hypothetical protein ACREX8_04120 [Gammaproteobacteria bacterium]